MDESDVALVEFAQAVADLPSLALATGRGDKVALVRLEVTDAVQESRRFPSDHDSVDPILDAHFGQESWLGAQPSGAQIVELVARGAGVHVDAPPRPRRTDNALGHPNAGGESLDGFPHDPPPCG